MNHLAHCFLSFGNEDLLLGNFIGDYIKGNQWEKYPLGVQRGILLHRTIDSFTDSNPWTHQCSARIRPYSKRFSGSVVDILFDHLLTLNWERYSPKTLSEFAQETYTMLEHRRLEMPLDLQDRLPRMVAGNFLQGYGHREGLDFVFSRFMKRLSIPFDQAAMLDFFEAHIGAFENDFNQFFPELIEKAKTYIQDN
jgi:acyl carrier protein phosphodiesterase